MPTIKDSLYFTYDGISCRDYKLANINTDNGMFEEIFHAERELIETKIRGNDKPLFHGIEESPLEFSLTIAFEEKYTDADIDNIILWLFKDTYKPLFFEDKPNKIYHCMPVGGASIVHNGLKEGYVTVNMRCNSSKVFSNIITTSTYSVRDISQTITINNSGHTSIYPEISILKNGRKTYIGDFANKVSGSAVENPHRSTGVVNNPNPTTVATEHGQIAYDKVSNLDSNIVTSSTSTNLNNIGHLFSFNLIELIERKWGEPIPALTTADKVAWLKVNVTKITANWHGYGSSPSGNRASVKIWDAVNNVWEGAWTHSLNSVGKIEASPMVIDKRFDSNGFVHFLAHAEPSDGTTSSTINTDYIDLSVDIIGLQGKVVIENISNGNKIFEIKDLTDQEDIYINCEKEIIETDIIGVYRYDKIIGEFLELIKGANQIKITGDCDISLRYKFKYKF